VTIPVRPSSFAQEEIEHYVRGYESVSLGLGDKLWRDIQLVVNLTSEYPEIGDVVRQPAD